MRAMGVPSMNSFARLPTLRLPESRMMVTRALCGDAWETRLNAGSKRDGGTSRDSLVFTGDVAQLPRSSTSKINARLPRLLTENGIMIIGCLSLGLLTSEYQ